MNATVFRERIERLSREEILEIIEQQNPNLISQIERIEYVFETRLSHIMGADGTPITSRPLTNHELALLVDVPFAPDRDLGKMGLTEEQQRQVHITRDPVLWARSYLNASPRVYQILILRDPNNRKVLRAGRRLGKSWSLSVMLLHYSYTHNHGRAVVVAPMKTQVELIYQEMLRMAKENPVVMESISRKVTSPQFSFEFKNGSTCRFFTSGIRSGGKSDVVRGQEAHIIVLDELDYMHPDDLIALLAMLQKTDEDQDDKVLVGASTPTGRHEIFYDWCHDPMFSEFWFPSFVNPYYDEELDKEFRLRYSEMAFRHEVEADWGEPAEGVYSRRFIDLAFSSGRLLVDPDHPDRQDEVIQVSDWTYMPARTSSNSFHVIGVDWDKYGAGTNIVVLECCNDRYEDVRAAGRVRLSYREEVPKDAYTLTNAVDRIIKLNELLQPRHIYVDRGFGEVQVEMLHKYGADHPASQLQKRVKGISFADVIEVRDPFTKQPTKKEMKPFMVDNLTQLLEKEELVFPSHDTDLYEELLAYVVARQTSTGRPVFEASGSKTDHVHDALILACLSLTENYGELMRTRYATRPRSISNEAFLPLFHLTGDDEERQEQIEALAGKSGPAPVFLKRTLTVPMTRSRSTRPIRRKMF